MSKHQRQQLRLVYELVAEAGLQLGGSEQELLTAWLIWHSACAILLLRASPLGPSAATVNITMTVKARAAVFFQLESLLKLEGK
jgi:hypothetical protein